MPSGIPVVSPEHEYTAALSTQAVIQVALPTRRNSISTEATPEPLPSSTAAVIVALPRRGVPSSTTVTAGAVLSTRRLETIEVAVLPASSVAVERRS